MIKSAESEINHQVKPFEGGRIMVHTLTLSVRGGKVGDLIYYFEPKGPYWKVEGITIEDENDHRKGYGTKLFRDFVRRIGSGQRVNGAIAHEPTRETLYERYGSKVPLEGFLRIEGDDLADIPLVGLRSKAGIANHAVILRYRPGDPGVDDPRPSDFYTMDLEGITGENK